MNYMILGVLLAAIDIYAWLFRPAAASRMDAFSVGIPILILVGVVKRPKNEWPAIVALAASFALFLNRVLIPSPRIAYACVLAASVVVIVLGDRLSAVEQR